MSPSSFAQLDSSFGAAASDPAAAAPARAALARAFARTFAAQALDRLAHTHQPQSRAVHAPRGGTGGARDAQATEGTQREHPPTHGETTTAGTQPSHDPEGQEKGGSDAH